MWFEHKRPPSNSLYSYDANESCLAVRKQIKYEADGKNKKHVFSASKRLKAECR